MEAYMDIGREGSIVIGDGDRIVYIYPYRIPDRVCVYKAFYGMLASLKTLYDIRVIYVEKPFIKFYNAVEVIYGLQGITRALCDVREVHPLELNAQMIGRRKIPRTERKQRIREVIDSAIRDGRLHVCAKKLTQHTYDALLLFLYITEKRSDDNGRRI